VHLDEFDERAGERPGMKEGDAVSAATHSGFPIHQFGAGGDEVAKGSIEIGHLDGDVVQPLAAPLQEAAHRGLGPEGHEYLKVRTAKRDHCLLHALLGDDLAGQWLHTEELHQ